MGHPLDISRKVNHRDIERRVTQQDRPGKSPGGCVQCYSLGMYNYPASGSGVIDVTYNAVTESIALPHDSTAAEIKALIDAHSEMALEPVECEVEAAADWPHGIMLVKMPPGATLFRTGQTLVRNTVAYLPEFRVDLCCT